MPISYGGLEAGPWSGWAKLIGRRARKVVRRSMVLVMMKEKKVDSQHGFVVFDLIKCGV